MRLPITKEQHGFSMVEILVVVAIIGILSSLSVMTVKNVTEASKDTIAQNLVETLNNAVKEFGHAQYELVNLGENTDSNDEKLILETLQWKDPGIELGVAGPFMRPDWKPTASNDTDDYRLVWSGSYWKMVKPGIAGAGLRVDFQTSDIGAEFSPEAGWTPFTSVYPTP